VLLRPYSALEEIMEQCEYVAKLHGLFCHKHLLAHGELYLNHKPAQRLYQDRSTFSVCIKGWGSYLVALQEVYVLLF
jgi:hypothetical protein